MRRLRSFSIYPKCVAPGKRRDKMAEWIKVGADVLVGGGLGAVDQLVQNWDVKREEESLVTQPFSGGPE